VLPPQQQPVTDEVAGFEVRAKKHERLAAHGLQDAAGHELFLDTHVMAQRLEGDEPARATASAVVTHVHCGFGVDADSQGLRIGICQRVHPPYVVKDGVGLGCFF